MFQWIAANWLTLVCAAAVLVLVAVSLWNVIPRKGKKPSCAGCSGCAACSGGCAGCSGCASRK